MPRLSIPPPILIKVLPIHCIPRHRLERRPGTLPTTLHNPTPLALALPILSHPLQPRKTRPATHTPVTGDIHHEAADAPPAAGRERDAPVVVVRVVAADGVPLRPDLLDEDVRPPALEGARARLDAADRRRAVQEGLFG